MPLIKFSVRIKWYYLLFKFVKNACQGTYAFKLTWPFAFKRIVNAHVQMGSNYPIKPGLHILLSGFHKSQGNDICSSFPNFPSGSLSFTDVLICLPVLSPHFGSVSSFCRSCCCKALGFYSYEREDRTCHATVRQMRPNTWWLYTSGFCH